MSQQHDLTGQVIASQFRLERKLGEGGMGVVYLAEQIDMGRPVVLKVLHPELSAGSPTAPERFKREARAVARLNHPHIVQVHVFGQTESTGQMYLVMEYVDGLTLTETMQSGQPMPQARALRVLDQVCSALVEAHGAGLVHRDLKPDNIMLADRHGTRDYVKVLDFGIAKMVDGDDGKTVTKTGAIFGTPRYMSPEQGRGELVDARTDLYALGVIFYELVSAHHPFEARGTLDMLLKHQSEPVVLPSRRFPRLGLMPRVETILARCLAKAPEDRFQSAAELQREVRYALRDLPEGARAWPTPGPLVPVSAPPPRPARKRSWLIPGVAIGLGFLATLGVLWLMRSAPEGPPPQLDPPTVSATTAPASVAPATTAPASVAPATTAPASVAPASRPPKRPKPPVVKTPPKRPNSVATAPPKPRVPKAAKDYQGLPRPVGATLQADTPQAVTFVADLDYDAALLFYQRALDARGWGPYRTLAQGLQVENPKSPVTGVWFTAQGHGLYLSLTRNPRLAQKAARVKKGSSSFGVKIYPGARTMMKGGNLHTLSIKAPVKTVIDWYDRRYGQIDGVMRVSRGAGDEATLTLMGAQAKVGWSLITIRTYSGGPPGTTMVVINKKS